MKRLILILAILLIPTIGFSATFGWDAHPQAGTILKGFNLYLTDSAKTYVVNIPDPTATQINVPLIQGVQFTIVLKAYSDGGESGPSNTVMFTNDPYEPPVSDPPPGPVSTPNSPTGLVVLNI